MKNVQASRQERAAAHPDTSVKDREAAYELDTHPASAGNDVTPEAGASPALCDIFPTNNTTMTNTPETDAARQELQINYDCGKLHSGIEAVFLRMERMERERDQARELAGLHMQTPQENAPPRALLSFTQTK